MPIAIKEPSSSTYGLYSTLVDTGSSNLGVTLNSCSSCGSGESTLNVPYNDEYCVGVTYGDGSYWKGYKSVTTGVGFYDRKFVV